MAITNHERVGKAMELLRAGLAPFVAREDEQVRGEKRKAGGSLIEAAASALKPWREIVTPHPDVASGRYQQAEFAADLWQVHLGKGSDEYRDPVELPAHQARWAADSHAVGRSGLATGRRGGLCPGG